MNAREMRRGTSSGSRSWRRPRRMVAPPAARVCGRARARVRARARARELVRFDTPFGFTRPDATRDSSHCCSRCRWRLSPSRSWSRWLIAAVPDVGPARLRPAGCCTSPRQRVVRVRSGRRVRDRAGRAARRRARRSSSRRSPRSSRRFHRVLACASRSLRGASFSSLLRSNWVYVIDAALSGIALVVAEDVHSAPVAALALVPLLGLLAMFAHERHQRLESLLELLERLPRHRARARRRDRGRRRLHRRALQERRRARARCRRRLGLGARAPAQPRVRRSAARRRQDRDPQGDHQQARQARPPRVDDHQDPHRRGPEDARARRRLHARGRH